jgi:hypothetical protein
MTNARTSVLSGAAYSWLCVDAGRAASKRPRQKNDCTVRALAIARGLPYDVAYDLLADAGRKCTKGFALPAWLNKQPWAKKIPFAAVKGERRMNPATFTQRFPRGRYICKVAKHVFAVVDGVVLDTFENAPDRCIYTAWEIA